MNSQTKIFIFLIFSLFIFNLAEQNVAKTDNLFKYAMQFPLNNQGDSNNQIADDTDYTCEEAIIGSTNPNFIATHSIKFILPHINRLIVPVIFKHWEPPK
jgi:hypothetical protein